MKLEFRSALNCLILALLPAALSAQVPSDFGVRNNRNDTLRTFVKDTVKTKYYFATNPGEEFYWTDTTLLDLHQYDPARQQDLDFATLGNLGSAAYPLFYKTPFRQGIDAGFHPFDLYRKSPEQLRFFRHPNGFTQASHSPGAEQADGYLQVLFGRDFAKGINFSLEHHSIFQKGQSFHFSHQQTKQSSLSAGLAITPENSRYQGYLIYASNASEQEDNGGLKNEAEIDVRPFEEAVTTETGNTRHSHYEVFLRHFLKFSGKRDSVSGVGRSFSVIHQFGYKNSDYKFSETNPVESGTDSTRYRLYQPFLMDDRGIRQFFEMETLSNAFLLQTFKSKKGTKSAAAQQNDLLEIGALHKIHWVNQEPEMYRLNELFLIGRFNFSTRKLLKIKTYAHFGLIDKTLGDYRVSASTQFDFDKWGLLSAEFSQQLSEPTLMEEKFYATQTKIWENDFSKTLSTQIYGNLSFPKINLTVGGKWQLLNNLVYFDTLSFPKQAGTPLSVFQAFVKKDFRVWRFHLDNLVAVQQLSEDFLALPSFFSKHSFYFEGPLFKRKLYLKVGFDARFFDNYRLPAYQPVTGQFYLQNSFSSKNLPPVDAFVSMKVGDFRAFFKMENTLSWLGTTYLQDNFGQKYFYQIARHPFPNSIIRWGISWKMSG